VITKLWTSPFVALLATTSGEPLWWTAIVFQTPVPRDIGLNGIGESAPVVGSME
jgi:hypothetical protein